LQTSVGQIRNQLKVLAVADDGSLKVPQLDVGSRSESALNKAQTYAKQAGPIATVAQDAAGTPAPQLPSSANATPAKVHHNMQMNQVLR
jgi:hypothetical protein